MVETTKVPLYLAIGPRCSVQIEDGALELWFSNILLRSNTSHGPDRDAWWQTARPDSPLGILVSVVSTGKNSQHISSGGPRVTELLLYASKTPRIIDHATRTENDHSKQNDSAVPRTTDILYALALSSDLYHEHSTEPTPPLSPEHLHRDDDAVFLPPLPAAKVEHINEPPVRKRKSAAEVFDEADDRRRKARRSGGAGVAAAAAAAPKPEPNMPSLHHRRSISHGHNNIPLQTRTLSRSPSIASSRPPTAVGQQRSSLSRVESLAGASTSDLETKNKELISRTVMAGMRLYGLVQKKSRKAATTGHASPAVDASFDNLEKDRRDEEEYKLIYHQVYRGTCVAFRSRIGVQDLALVAEVVRDVVDRLLMIFCTDPLADVLATKVAKLTPGGRKAFASG